MLSIRLSIFFIVLLGMLRPAHAVLTIEITQGLEGALPIAVVPFSVEGNATPPAINVAEIIAADLYRSGFFSPLAAQDLIARPSDAAQVNFYIRRGESYFFLVKNNFF